MTDQREHWEEVFSRNPDLYGAEPSEPARIAAGLFREEGIQRILELGGGQGRDALFFARRGFQIDVLDYSEAAVQAIAEKSLQAGLSEMVTAGQHDVRTALPFPDETFDACYSHMLFCMALTTPELVQLSREIHRVLRPLGLHVYTVRHTGDPHYGQGIRRGEDIYEVDGFAVHFFSRPMVESLAEGFDLIGIEAFEEGDLPRKLFRVSMRKK